jgi:site-specific DNA-methyltransferase (adenine-specific)
MGKEWDGQVPGVPFWQAALRVAKPGAHLLAFGGTRTHHRLMCAIEDAGWEIRDCVMWVYGSGFPKSLDVGKAIDKAAGVEREVIAEAQDSANRRVGSFQQENGKPHGMVGNSEGQRYITAPATGAAKQWGGWGTALKPAWEPIILARKPLMGTVAANVQKHGTAGLNIDGCRVTTDEDLGGGAYAKTGGRADLPGAERSDAAAGMMAPGKTTGRDFEQPVGRWPANVVHDGSEEVVGMFPQTVSGTMRAGTRRAAQNEPGSVCYGTYGGNAADADTYGDSGSAARFFYCAKASRSERGEDNNHPTVKPVALMRWLCRLITPPDGLILDPFCGSGSTGVAASLEGFRFIGIDVDAGYCEIARQRIASAKEQTDLFTGSGRTAPEPETFDRESA